MAQKRAAGSPIGGRGRTGLESNRNAAAGLIKGAEQHGPNKIKLFFSFFSKTWLNVELVHWTFWNNILNIEFKQV